MRNEHATNKPGRLTKGDLFDDLGFSHAETLEAKIKSDILHAIVNRSQQRNLSQAELAQILKVHQPDVSNLLKGKISRFSITRLIQFASRLDLDARVEIKPYKCGVIPLNASVAKPPKSASAKAKVVA